MSIHIAAKKGEIAPKVLFPGDPLRAKFIAENFLTDSVCYSKIRNMYGFTGLYKGERVSVQGSGMGIPSSMIYATELFQDYDVQQVIRVGSAGAMQEDVHIRDIVLAQAAVTDSSLLQQIFRGQVNFCPIADFKLLQKAYQVGQNCQSKVHVGNVLSSDRFYNEELDKDKLTAYGVLAVEMEAAGLYTLAAQFHRQALAIMTISDHLLTGEVTTAQEREQTFLDMIQIALNL